MEYLSKGDLRRLELEDEHERKIAAAEEENIGEQLVHHLPDGRDVLLYQDFLETQRFYDDLKHSNSDFVDYDGLLVEQDKSLGKGGLCWDAAFILAEYLSASSCLWTKKHPGEKCITSVVELGAGTGVCGLLLAKQVTGLKVILTDLPELQALLSRNASRFIHGPGDDILLKEYISATRKSDDIMPRSTVDVSTLDWADCSCSHGTFDVVLGADVVATLYDPVALAHTIHRLCHDKTRVYISFKERLSSIHRQFESEMDRLFSEILIIHNNSQGKTLSRNHNPDVHILIAKDKVPVT